MLLTEHESKAVLAEAVITVPEGFVVDSPAGAMRIQSFPVAVKAQVASGGRGLAGGVLKAASQEEAQSAVARIMAMEFGGTKPQFVLIEPWLPIERELYLSVTVDGAADGYCILYGPKGGVAVERGAPPVRYAVGHPSAFRAHVMRRHLMEVEPDPSLRERVISLAARLLQLAQSQDLITVEINPLARLQDGRLVAADAKVVVDESARFRSRRIASAVARSERSQPEMVAAALQQRLMLVWLGGEIGLISGGAGMTMAAMDMLNDAGGAPACFLDCSGNPTPGGYETAFRLLDEQHQVKAILVAIFGGGTHMDRVARVMVKLMGSRVATKPVVFRLNGTNGEAVGPIFDAAGLKNFLMLEDAVDAVIAAARGGKA